MFETLIWLLLATLIARNVLVYSLTLLARSGFAQKRRIEEAPIKPEQLQRERLMTFKGTVMDALFAWVFFSLGWVGFTSESSWLEVWVIVGVHFVVVEPLYYAYHRLLHWPWFYKNHHVHHHLSRVTNPNTSFTFTLLERFSYTLLFSLPLFAASWLGCLSVWGFFVYVLAFDFMNSVGHLNFEIFPRWYQKSFLRYLFYTPTFHAKHHTKFRANYALFVPLWDRLFKTESV